MSGVTRFHAGEDDGGDAEDAPAGGRHRGRSRRRRTLTDRAVAVVSIAALLAAAGWTVREGMSDLLGIQANQRVAQWEMTGALSPAQAAATENTLRRAIDLSPRNGDHWESLGTLHFAAAVAPGRSPEGRARDFARAVAAYREATERSRVSGYAWANLMLAKHYADQIDPEFHRALDRAMRFAPLETPVQAMVLSVVLPRWDELGDTARSLAAEAVRRGWERGATVLVNEARVAPGRERWCAQDAALTQPGQAEAMRQLCEALNVAPSDPGTLRLR